MKSPGRRRSSVSKPLCTSILLFILLLSFSCDSSRGKETFRFVFMTDIHIQPERNAVEGFRTAIAHVNGLNPRPEFIIIGGDLMMDAADKDFTRADSLYNLFAETARSFQMPVHACIGNNDLLGLNPKSGVDNSHPEFGKNIFVNRIAEGRTYRSFDHGTWHFILLDPIKTVPDGEYTGEIDSVQLRWLEEDLKKVGTEKPVVLALHIPLYTATFQFVRGPLTANTPQTVVINALDVQKICQPYNVRLVLQGHLHVVEEIVWKGTHYITGGAVCGAWWRGPMQGFHEGFVVMDVKGDDFTWDYETYGWRAEN